MRNLSNIDQTRIRRNHKDTKGTKFFLSFDLCVFVVENFYYNILKNNN